MGLEPSVVNNPTVVKKLFQGIMLPADKKMASELELDKMATRFFHAFN